MRLVFDLKRVAEMLIVSAVAGTASFLMLPMIASGLLSHFVAAFTATVISIPLTYYFLDVPEGKISIRKYFEEKMTTGLLLDILLLSVISLGPAAIFMYFMFTAGFLMPVPVASAAALGIFTGYSGFLFRNRRLYDDGKVDVVF